MTAKCRWVRFVTRMRCIARGRILMRIMRRRGSGAIMMRCGRRLPRRKRAAVEVRADRMVGTEGVIGVEMEEMEAAVMEGETEARVEISSCWRGIQRVFRMAHCFEKLIRLGGVPLRWVQR